MKRAIFLASVLLALTSVSALAHTGVGSASGLGVGFAHPASGLDHMLAMLAVGILAAQLGGAAIWILPSAFVGMMSAGAVLGLSPTGMPLVEQGIVGSVVILGAVIALGRRLPIAVAAILVGLLAVFHGYAHGTEMPLDTNGLAYGMGFAAATLLLHLAGIAVGLGAQKASDRLSAEAVRISGAAIGLAGVALIVA